MESRVTLLGQRSVFIGAERTVEVSDSFVRVDGGHIYPPRVALYVFAVAVPSGCLSSYRSKQQRQDQQ